MKKTAFFALLLSLSLAAPAFAQQSLDAMIDREIAQLVSTYKMLHAAPELSHYEVKTSAFFAAQLRSWGFRGRATFANKNTRFGRAQAVEPVWNTAAGPDVRCAAT